jgi:hypothetical protein
VVDTEEHVRTVLSTLKGVVDEREGVRAQLPEECDRLFRARFD